MKLFLGLLLLVSQTAFAGATSGTTLKKQVEKMGACTGVNSIAGYDLVFTKEQKSVQGTKTQVLAMTVPADAYNTDEYTTDDEYAYTVSEGEGSPVVAYTPWKVKGKKVLVYVKGEWLSLVIGFKSKTCWF